MRKNLSSLIASLGLCAGLAIPVCVRAQNIATQESKATHHHYKLIDVGTLGGPSSFFSGPILQILNNRGTFAVIANTPAANPNPGCNIPFSLPDCFVEHAAVWHGGTLIDLGVLAGGVNSGTAAISANGLIAGGRRMALSIRRQARRKLLGFFGKAARQSILGLCQEERRASPWVSTAAAKWWVFPTMTYPMPSPWLVSPRRQGLFCGRTG